MPFSDVVEGVIVVKSCEKWFLLIAIDRNESQLVATSRKKIFSRPPYDRSQKQT